MNRGPTDEGVAAVDVAPNVSRIRRPTYNKALVIDLFRTDCVRIQQMDCLAARRTAEGESSLVEWSTVLSIETAVSCARPEMSANPLTALRGMLTIVWIYKKV
jgi:hypothetical protein